MTNLVTSESNKIHFPNKRKKSVNLGKQPLLDTKLIGKQARLERRFLSSIFENSNHCMRPEEKKQNGHQWSYRPETTYFSSISLSLRYLNGVKDESHYELVEHGQYGYLTYSSKIKIEQFEALVFQSVNKALDEVDNQDDSGGASRLIAINEFGFPCFRQRGERNAFLKKLKEIANGRNAFILSGSAHCTTRLQNIAALSQPRNEETIEHQKFSSAINLGERLKPRTDLFWNYYATTLGRIGVLICFDVIDPSVLLRQIYFSRDVPKDNRIDLYIIPTFSPNDRVRDQAEMLSYFTKSIVLYVNCQYIDPQTPNTCPESTSVRTQSHGLFVAGEDVTDNINLQESSFSQSISILQPSVCKPEVGNGDIWASIITHRVKQIDIITELHERQNDFSPIINEILSLAKLDPSFKRS